MDKAVKLLVISIFRKKYFRNLHVITKITKIWSHTVYPIHSYGILVINTRPQLSKYGMAGNFRGTKFSWLSSFREKNFKV